MNEKNSQIIEQINAIKAKLIKYTNLKSHDKINEYLHNLSRFRLNDDISKRTDIMNCLKNLKNKENPAFSSKANDLIKQFKQELIASMPSAETAKLTNENKLSKKEVSTGQLVVKKPTTTNTIVKKRPSTTTNDLVKPMKNFKTDDDSHSCLSKKPKLSLSDYKLLKGSSSNENSKSESLSDSRGSSSSSSSNSQYEIESDLADNNYSPTPKNILNTQNNIIMPPVPLEPLGKILINENKTVAASSSYEPTKTMNKMVTPSIQNNSKNKISKYSSLIVNTVAKEVNNNNNKNKCMTNDDDALTQIMKQKGQHKQILYTGKRNFNGASNTAPKLFDMCVRVLTNTLNELPNRISIYNTVNEYPIAFNLIKPVIERANARQLESCENHSPNLLEDTDYIWKKICEREFKELEPPEEDESWRELYFRKLSERDEEFDRARIRISSKQRPVERTTKLATNNVSANRVVRRTTTTSSSSSSVRTMIPLGGGGSSSFKRSSNSSSNSRFGPQAPPMSQGRKDIMKLIKKSTRR